MLWFYSTVSMFRYIQVCKFLHYVTIGYFFFFIKLHTVISIEACCSGVRPGAEWCGRSQQGAEQSARLRRGAKRALQASTWG